MADYAYDRACRLEAKGYKPEQGWKSRNMVSVSENGKTYKVEVGRHLDSAVFQALRLNQYHRNRPRPGIFKSFTPCCR